MDNYGFNIKETKFYKLVYTEPFISKAKQQENKIKVSFRLCLEQYLAQQKVIDDPNYNTDFFTNERTLPSGRITSKRQQWLRLLGGYNATLGIVKPSWANLWSKKALEGGKYTKDHTLGVTLVGKIILNEIESRKHLGMTNDEIISDMCNNWVMENLHLWVEVKILKEQHTNDNLSRDLNQLSDYENKLNLLHYENGNIIIVKK